MAIEEGLMKRGLPPAERERLIREIEEQLANGELRDVGTWVIRVLLSWSEDSVTWTSSSAGAMAKPEEPRLE